jgi:hypothetical protein
MGNDRSLDDFLGDEDETPAVSESEGDLAETGETGDDGDIDAANTDTDTVEPATPTYRFSPDGAACDVCEATVEKRWHDDGRFVCADCKEW